MIDLQLVVLLDAVKRRGTLAAAAEELGKVPSALSYTIQKYEEEQGYSLFQRSGRGVRFTEAARHLHAQGMVILEQTTRLQDEASAIAFGREPRLRIAVEAWLTLEAIAPALARFYEQFPDVEVDVTEEVMSGTWEALIEGRVDLVIGAPTPKPQGSGIQTEILGTLESCFAVAPHHPIAKTKGPATSVALEQERWIILRDSARSWVPRDMLAFTPKRRMLVQSMRDKIDAQIAGLGVGYLPVHLAKPYLNRGELVLLPVLDEREQTDLLLAWRTDSRGVALEYLRECVIKRFGHFDA